MSVEQAKRRLAEWADRPLSAPVPTGSALGLTVAAAVAGLVVGRFAGRRTARALVRLALREPRLLAVAVPALAGLLSGRGRPAPDPPSAAPAAARADDSR
jgi:hypothetical protein